MIPPGERIKARFDFHLRKNTLSKNTLLLAVLLLSGMTFGCRQGEGQQQSFSKGMWDLSIAGSLKVHSIENDQIDHSTMVSMSPQVGYFFTDRLEVLVGAGVEFQDLEYNSSGAPLEVDRVRQQNYSAALGLQYNLDDGSRIVPFFRTYGGILKSRKETEQHNIPIIGTATIHDETTAPFIGVRVGIRYFLVPGKLASDIGLGWKRIFYDDDFGGDTDDTSLVIGCSILY
jgi:hypothetical protein